MANRFFTPLGAPQTFNPPTSYGSVSGSSASRPAQPSDEEVKRQAIRTAKAGAYVDVPGGTADAGELTGSEDASGLSVNLPSKKVYSEEKYYKSLSDAGYGDFAQEEQKRTEEIKQQEIITQNKKMDWEFKAMDAAMGQAFAGDPQGAFITANKYLPKGLRLIEPPKVVGKDDIFVKTEDNPDGAKINRLEFARLQADAKSKMDGYFDMQQKVMGDKTVVYQTHKTTGEQKVLATINNGDASKDEMEKANPLRKEYLTNSNTKDYLDKGTSYSQILAANLSGLKSGKNRGASDMAIIYSYMKLLDPTSTVREGEYASARNAQGVPAQVQTLYNRLLQGDQLGATQRTEILKTSESIFNASKTVHDAAPKATFTSYAKAAGVRPELVVGDWDFEKSIANTKKETESLEKDTPKSGYPQDARKVKRQGTVTSGPNKGKTKIEYEDGSTEYK